MEFFSLKCVEKDSISGLIKNSHDAEKLCFFSNIYLKNEDQISSLSKIRLINHFVEAGESDVKKQTSNLHFASGNYWIQYHHNFMCGVTIS